MWVSLFTLGSEGLSVIIISQIQSEQLPWSTFILSMLRTFCYQSFEVAPSWSGTPSILFFSFGFFLCCWISFYFRFLSLGKKER